MAAPARGERKRRNHQLPNSGKILARALKTIEITAASP
jgi:hypothetical protein